VWEVLRGDAKVVRYRSSVALREAMAAG